VAARAWRPGNRGVVCLVSDDLSDYGRSRCAVCESLGIDRYPPNAVWGGQSCLCSEHSKIFGKRRDWPPWVREVVNAEARRRRRNQRARKLGTDLAESDVGPDDPFSYWESASDDGGIVDGLRAIDTVDLFRDAKLTMAELTAVLGHLYAGYSFDLLAGTGHWPSGAAAREAWGRALRKMKGVLQRQQEDFRMEDTYSVRMSIAVSWTGISAKDRVEAQQIAETLTRQLLAAAVGTPDGVSLGDDIAIGTSEIRGPSVPRRPRMAIHGFPDGVAFGSQEAVKLGGTQW